MHCLLPGLGVRDAVPLSKSVVFIGSIASLFLNLRTWKTRRKLTSEVEWHVWCSECSFNIYIWLYILVRSERRMNVYRKSEKHVGRSQIVDEFRDRFQLWEMHCRKATATRESLIDYNVCRLASSLVLNPSLFWDTTQVWALKAHLVTLRVFCWLAPLHCIIAYCVSLFIDHDIHRPRNHIIWHFFGAVR